MAEQSADTGKGLAPRRHEPAGHGEPAERRGLPSSQAADGTAEGLAQVLADLARQMQRQTDAASVMQTIVSAVPGTIPGAEEATISLVRARRRVVSAAATGATARRFDELQQATHQGPCLDAMYEHLTVRVDDLAADPRWPNLARRVTTELGMASMLCIQLFVHDNDLGALNLLARRPAAFTEESEQVALVFASHAAVAVADAQNLTQVTAALRSRDVIGQAKGILMERYKITAEGAFALLAKTSQDTNRKLSEVAQSLAHTGDLSD